MIKYINFIVFLCFISITSISKATVSDDNIKKKLSELSIPIVFVTTVEGEEPDCEYVDPPQGCMGLGIANATKVPSRMVIVTKGDTVYDSGEYVKKESGLTINIRGNTSAYREKKSYKLKLQKKADLLKRGDNKYEDKDWILLRTGSTLNTKVGFWLSELIRQEWTPAHQIVNLFINNVYRGLYILTEQISVNQQCRVNLDEDEGYMVEFDAYYWNEDLSFPSNIGHHYMQFTYKYPDSEDITPDKSTYIQDDVHRIENSIMNNCYDNDLDCESFAKWLLAQDILGNWDSCGSNIYIVKPDNYSKLQMGPLWDFDCCFIIADNWTGIHLNDVFWFNSLLNSTNEVFRLAYINLWDTFGSWVIGELCDRLNQFSISEEGRDYNATLKVEKEAGIIIEEKSGYDDCDLEDMTSFIEDFLLSRYDWIDSRISDILSEVKFNSLTDEYTNNITYDIWGRSISKDTKEILIRNRKKYLKNK